MEPLGRLGPLDPALLARVDADVAAVEEVAAQPDHHPRDADEPGLGFQDHHRQPGGEGPDPPEHGGERQPAPAEADVPRHPVGAVAVGVLVPERDHRDVRGGERQHRAERVEVAEERGLPRDEEQDREERVDDDREPRRPVAAVDPREDRRELAVLGQRPRQPRDPDQPRVRGDDQDRR